MILRNLNPILSSELLSVMMNMGHGDEIVFTDRNFPCVNTKKVIPYNGVSIQPLLDAVLYHLPIDYVVETPALMMEIPKDSDYKGNVFGDYQKILNKYNPTDVKIGYLKRQDFYDRAAKAYAVVTTSDSERFANIIIRKGIIRAGEEYKTF
jgi:L-fucose mutarotase